jgi:hypothetical protein
MTSPESGLQIGVECKSRRRYYATLNAISSCVASANYYLGSVEVGGIEALIGVLGSPRVGWSEPSA